MKPRSWVGGLLVGLVLLGTFTIGFVAWVARERALHRELALAQAMRAEAMRADKADRVFGAAVDELARLRVENVWLRSRVRELESKPGVSGDRPGPGQASGSPATSPSR